MFSEPLRDVNRKQPPQRVDTQYVAIASRPQDGSVESELGSLHFPGALPFVWSESFFPPGIHLWTLFGFTSQKL